MDCLGFDPEPTSPDEWNMVKPTPKKMWVKKIMAHSFHGSWNVGHTLEVKDSEYQEAASMHRMKLLAAEKVFKRREVVSEHIQNLGVFWWHFMTIGWSKFSHCQSKKQLEDKRKAKFDGCLACSW